VPEEWISEPRPPTFSTVTLNNMATQNEQILNYLQTHKTITSLQAINEFGVTRLSHVIYSLKKEGHNIYTETISVKNRFGKRCSVASYSLVK